MPASKNVENQREPARDRSWAAALSSAVRKNVKNFSGLFGGLCYIPAPLNDVMAGFILAETEFLL
ncbi:MAG TPA: hypothetical protein VF988_11915 [Verrucomicrobiae bacterium]